MIWSSVSIADGAVVDKVYHPYVLPNEREIEWRLMSRKNDSGNQLAQRIAFGHALSERFTVELYLVGERDSDDNFSLASYEIEGRWMLTDQGQYWADYGWLFEIEKAHKADQFEATTGLLIEKEFGRASVTANLLVAAEFGANKDTETEAEFRMQYRYRYLAEIQPAIELYSSKDFLGIGPAFMGLHRFQGQKQLKWEMAFISGLNGDNQDHTLRFLSLIHI